MASLVIDQQEIQNYLANQNFCSALRTKKIFTKDISILNGRENPYEYIS
jgi:hypothetical protein